MAEDDLVLVTNECSNCFYMQKDWVERDSYRQPKLFLCDFCKDHPEACVPVSDAQIERILEILHSTNLSQFPNAIRLLYRNLKKGK